jgi:hypothetical protein
VTPRAALLFLACAGLASAQRVLLLSEFQRMGPDGKVYSADRIERPREFLSPAVARNSHLTLRVAVRGPFSAPYTLHIGQNPEDRCSFTLYQEKYTRAGEERVPDALEKVEIPHSAQLSEGQAVQTYLLDILIPSGIPVERFRLEIQLNDGDTWGIFPMEIRVRSATVTGAIRPPRGLPPVEERADAIYARLLRGFACNGDAGAGPEPEGLTARSLVRRNALELLALARERAREESMTPVVFTLLSAAGWGAQEEFCKSHPSLAPRGAEWALRARDYLVQNLPVR